MTTYTQQVVQQMQRQAQVLQAVRHLSNHGHHQAAQAVWDMAFERASKQVLLPGEAQR